jgi:hypothetical protein
MVVLACTVVASEFVLYDALTQYLPTMDAAATALWTAAGEGTWHFVSMLDAWSTGGTDPLVYVDPAQAYHAIIGSFIVLASSENVLADNPDAEFIAAHLYTIRAVGPSFGNSYVGPLINATCGHTETLDEHPGGECQCNKGSNTYHVRSLNRWMQAIVDPTDTTANEAPADFTLQYSAASCGMQLLPLVRASASTTLRDALIFASSCSSSSCSWSFLPSASVKEVPAETTAVHPRTRADRLLSPLRTSRAARRCGRARRKKWAPRSTRTTTSSAASSRGAAGTR